MSDFKYKPGDVFYIDTNELFCGNITQTKKENITKVVELIKDWPVMVLDNEGADIRVTFLRSERGKDVPVLNELISKISFDLLWDAGVAGLDDFLVYDNELSKYPVPYATHGPTFPQIKSKNKF
jgi:hypothetical protein